MKYSLDISYLRSLYDIKEDGSVFDLKRKRVVVPIVRNGYKVIRVSSLHVNVGLGYLVCLFYHGEPPTPNHEPCHLNGDKMNNKADNLAWKTHGQIVKRTYERGRRPYWKNKRRGKYSEETKAKMSEAKNKRVVCDDKMYPSVESVLGVLGVSRHTFNNHIASGVIKGHKVSFYQGLSFLDSAVPKLVITPHPVSESYSLPEIEANYDIHPDGRVYSKKAASFLKPIDTGLNIVYNVRVKWYNVQVSAARLVAMKYVAPVAGKKQVGHKDDNYYNNEATNLVWQSPSETRLKGNNTDYWWKNNLKQI